MFNLKSILLVGGFGAAMVAACGPASRDGGGHGGDGTTDGGAGDCSNPSPEVCGDGVDNDCDGNVDCADVDCSGVGNCPVCGAVDDPEATPIILPDGISSGHTCTTDTDCAGTAETTGMHRPTPNCITFTDTTDSNKIKHECHASYSSVLNFVGFTPGATLDDTSKLLKVCANIEHSWLHDLNFELYSPPDAGGLRRKITLQAFVGRVYTEIFLGHPIDDDDGTPHPGTPFEYCWTQAATTEMYDANMISYMSTDEVPPGDYKSMSPWTDLQGAPLDGQWEMRITDLFGSDNGYMSGWKIAFDPSLVANCNGPIIGKVNTSGD